MGEIPRKSVSRRPERRELQPRGERRPGSSGPRRLCRIGEGWVLEDDELVPACRALARARLEPTRLRTKEGLTLINGTDGRCWGWHVRYPSGGVG